jgi:hypothetical protein
MRNGEIVGIMVQVAGLEPATSPLPREQTLLIYDQKTALHATSDGFTTPFGCHKNTNIHTNDTQNYQSTGEYLV